MMLSAKKCLCLFIKLTLFSCVSNYRILGVFPVPGRSHYFLGSRLMKGLALAGHDVTIIAPFKDNGIQHLPKNGSYREIVVEELDEAQKKRKYVYFSQ